MIATLSKYKTLIIIIVVIILIFLAYGAFGPKSAPTTGALSRVDSGVAVGGTSGNAANGPDGQFVSQLLAIKDIHFDTTILLDPAYLYLQDFSRPLVPQEVGRPNPFAPIGQQNGSALGTSSATFSVGTGSTATTSSKNSRPSKK